MYYKLRKRTAGLMLVLVLILSLFSWQPTIAQMMRGRHGMRSEMQVIHQLFASHDHIYRNVEQLPNGIRATTESDNPEIAALIKAHVASMYDRIDQQYNIPGRHMSPSLEPLLSNADRYQRTLQLTDKGVVITETSSDTPTIAAIREHAKEVDQFLVEGMPSMMGN